MFYCPRALADGDQSIRISEKTLEFSSALDSAIYNISMGVIYTVGWASGTKSGL